MLIKIIIHKIFFKCVRDKSDRDSHLKSFEIKNEKSSFLNFRILKLIKFNRDDNIKILYIYKNNENKRKSEFEIEYKKFIYFHCDKKKLY